jgi:hypothetical protein
MFTLNGKQHKDIELTFNDVCDLQEKGVDLTAMNPKNALPTIRAIISLRFGGNEQLAGIEIEQHLINGGTFEDLAEIVKKAVEGSGFFQALRKNQAS